jgi:hypothetical protein
MRSANLELADKVFEYLQKFGNMPTEELAKSHVLKPHAKLREHHWTYKFLCRMEKQGYIKRIGTTSYVNGAISGTDETIWGIA